MVKGRTLVNSKRPQGERHTFRIALLPIQEQTASGSKKLLRAAGVGTKKGGTCLPRSLLPTEPSQRKQEKD